MVKLCAMDVGADFQKAFSRTGGLHALAKCPFMALTASASPTIAPVNPVVVSQTLNRLSRKSSLAISLLLVFL